MGRRLLRHPERRCGVNAPEEVALEPRDAEEPALPCPFCGVPPKVLGQAESRGAYVACRYALCGVRPSTEALPAGDVVTAIRIWNIRKPTDDAIRNARIEGAQMERSRAVKCATKEADQAWASAEAHEDDVTEATGWEGAAMCAERIRGLIASGKQP